MRAESKETARREKMKFLPSSRSVSMSSQDGRPEKPARRGAYSRSVGGQSVTVVPAKGKHYSSSSAASSSDEEGAGSRPALSTSSRTLDRNDETVGAVARDGAGGGRRGSCSSFVSYTAESVRSNSSATNVDPSSDESPSNHPVKEYKHTATNNNNESNKTAYSNSSSQPVDRQANLLEKSPLTKSRSDINELKPGSKDSKNKPSPSISSKFRFGRKNKAKDSEKSSERGDGEKIDADSVKSQDGAKGSKGKTGTDRNPELNAKRSNSFEEVYDSNVNRLLETMRGSTLPNTGREKDKKPRWEDVKVRPGPTGKNISFLFQQSLSLNEELAENAKWYNSCDDSENWVGGSEFLDKFTDKSLSIDDIDVAKSTSGEGLLSPWLHKRPQQQLSREEGKMASTSSESNKTATHDEADKQKASSSVLATRIDVERKDTIGDIQRKHDGVQQRKKPVPPQTYSEQHAALISRTPDREIPESLKLKLCRAGSAASDTLSIIHETSESGRDDNSLSSNDKGNSGVISCEEDSDDTLFGCESRHSLSDDEKPVSLFQDTIEEGERGKTELSENIPSTLQMDERNLQKSDSSFAGTEKRLKEDLVLLVFDGMDDREENKIPEKILDLDFMKKTNTYSYNNEETDTQHVLASRVCEAANNSTDTEMLENISELENIDKTDYYEKYDNSQGSSVFSLADSNPECFVLENVAPSQATTEKIDRLSDLRVDIDVEPKSEDIGKRGLEEETTGVNRTSAWSSDTSDSEGKVKTLKVSPPLANSCSVDGSLQGYDNDGDVVDNAGAADEDGDDSSSSRTSADSGGQKETLLKMALRAERENHLLQRERAERAREQEERRRLEAAEKGLPLPPTKPRRDPDNDSLTSGHLSISSRDESSTGQGGSGFFSRLKTRARRKGYPRSKPSVTKPVTK